MSDGFAKESDTTDRVECVCDAGDEDRHDGYCVEGAEQELQRLGETVVEYHPFRDRKVDALGQHIATRFTVTAAR